MPQWSSPLLCVANDGLFSLHYPDKAPTGGTVRNVIDAAGPQVLPMPSRRLTEEQLSAWFRAWRRAGYEFQNAG